MHTYTYIEYYNEQIKLQRNFAWLKNKNQNILYFLFFATNKYNSVLLSEFARNMPIETFAIVETLIALDPTCTWDLHEECDNIHAKLAYLFLLSRRQNKNGHIKSSCFSKERINIFTYSPLNNEKIKNSQLSISTVYPHFFIEEIKIQKISTHKFNSQFEPEREILYVFSKIKNHLFFGNLFKVHVIAPRHLLSKTTKKYIKVTNNSSYLCRIQTLHIRFMKHLNNLIYFVHKLFTEEEIVNLTQRDVVHSMLKLIHTKDDDDVYAYLNKISVTIFTFKIYSRLLCKLNTSLGDTQQYLFRT